MLDDDDHDALGKSKRRDLTVHKRRSFVEPELEKLDLPAREDPGVYGSRRHDDPFDRLGKLRLGPRDLVDPKMLAQALDTAGWPEEILLADEADRLVRTELAGDRTGHDVDLIEPRRGDQQVGLLHAGPLEHLWVGPTTVDKLDIEVAKSVRSCRIRIDNGDVVLERQRLRERVADTPATDDDDSHYENVPGQPAGLATHLSFSAGSAYFFRGERTCDILAAHGCRRRIAWSPANRHHRQLYDPATRRFFSRSLLPGSLACM